MEQQTISIAKAGLLVKLPTRTAVIACCNPKGQYDLSSDISVNTAIAGPLLSRFDIVLVLLDRPNKEWDKNVSTHLLRRAIDVGGGSSRGTSSPENGKDELEGNKRIELQKVWDEQTLHDYIAQVKRLKPTMTAAAQQLIVSPSPPSLSTLFSTLFFSFYIIVVYRVVSIRCSDRAKIARPPGRPCGCWSRWCACRRLTRG
jgi:DNA helicase MCM9